MYIILTDIELMKVLRQQEKQFTKTEDNLMEFKFYGTEYSLKQGNIYPEDDIPKLAYCNSKNNVIGYKSQNIKEVLKDFNYITYENSHLYFFNEKHDCVCQILLNYMTAEPLNLKNFRQSHQNI